MLAIPPELAASQERLNRLKRMIADAQAANAARRARVLADPELAKELTKPPLNFARPEQWNGYIPPALDQLAERERCRDAEGFPNDNRKKGPQYATGQHRNESPRRAVLVAIAKAAAMPKEAP